MRIGQELILIKDKMILAHIEVCALEEEVKSLEPKEKADKLLKRIKQLKEEIESCI